MIKAEIPRTEKKLNLNSFNNLSPAFIHFGRIINTRAQRRAEPSEEPVPQNPHPNPTGR